MPVGRGKMEHRRRVVLCGDSVVIAGVGASLQRRQGLQVLSVAASPATTPQDLEILSPEVVVLDLSVVTMEFAFALLRERPDLLLIGLDPGGDRLLVLSGQQARDLTTEDLVWLIQNGAYRRQRRIAGGRRITSRSRLPP